MSKNRIISYANKSLAVLAAVLWLRIRIGSEPQHLSDPDPDRHPGHVIPDSAESFPRSWKSWWSKLFCRKFKYTVQNTKTCMAHCTLMRNIKHLWGNAVAKRFGSGSATKLCRSTTLVSWPQDGLGYNSDDHKKSMAFLTYFFSMFRSVGWEPGTCSSPAVSSAPFGTSLLGTKCFAHFFSLKKKTDVRPNRRPFILCVDRGGY